MPNRLVTFGDSFTEGCGLVLDDQLPANIAWPQKLADKLRLECSNQGFGGCSVKEVLDRILRFQYQSTDTVVILWPVETRRCIFYDFRTDLGGNYKNICTSSIEHEPYYKKYHADYDDVWEFMVFLHCAQTHLESKVKRVKHISCSMEYFSRFTTPLPITELVGPGFPDREPVVYAKYDKHLGEIHHEDMACYLQKELLT